jgi:hypothetical protein
MFLSGLTNVVLDWPNSSLSISTTFAAELSAS